MKPLLLFVLLFISHKTYAFDLDNAMKFVKEKVAKLTGSQKSVEIRESSVFEMPKIPTVNEDATSTAIYNKKGKLISQGSAFNKLTLEEKRKYRIGFIRELYFTVRDSEPKKEEILTSLNALEQNGTREGIYRALVLDQIYRSLEGVEDAPSAKLVVFSVEFGQKYLGRVFSKEIIEKINVWGIKRVLTEKMLEVVDAFKTDGEDFYKWYALFSGDIAQKYSNIWKSKIRKSDNVLAHHKWVQTVPFQHVKSELIIKLHKLLNYLNTKK